MVHATSHSNSQGNIACPRILAQARCWPSWYSIFSPKREEMQGSSRTLAQARCATWFFPRFLAQARCATWQLHDISLRRDLLAWARLCVAQDEKGPPGRALVAGSTLVLSPRRDKLAWAKIAEFATAQPHAVAETAQIYSQTHMQDRITT